MATQPGEVHWSELMTRDPAAARAFFETVAGWTIEEFPMGEGPPYSVCMAGGKPVAGILGMAAMDGADMPPQWMTYIHVADVDAACEQAVAAGGKVCKPCFDVPQVGRIAMIQDPTGAEVGIITPAAEE